jgi:hypothetical protein
MKNPEKVLKKLAHSLAQLILSIFHNTVLIRHFSDPSCPSGGFLWGSDQVWIDFSSVECDSLRRAIRESWASLSVEKEAR